MKAIYPSPQAPSHVEEVFKTSELKKRSRKNDVPLTRLYASKITIIVPSGIMNAQSGSLLKQQLFSAINADPGAELFIDMSAVESLNNAGLVSLMQALNAVRDRTRNISILSAPPSIRIVFELTQLDQIFTMTDESLIASQGQSPGRNIRPGLGMPR